MLDPLDHLHHHITFILTQYIEGLQILIWLWLWNNWSKLYLNAQVYFYVKYDLMLDGWTTTSKRSIKKDIL